MILQNGDRYRLSFFNTGILFVKSYFKKDSLSIHEIRWVHSMMITFAVVRTGVKFGDFIDKDGRKQNYHPESDYKCKEFIAT